MAVFARQCIDPTLMKGCPVSVFVSQMPPKLEPLCNWLVFV